MIEEMIKRLLPALFLTVLATTFSFGLILSAHQYTTSISGTTQSASIANGGFPSAPPSPPPSPSSKPSATNNPANDGCNGCGGGTYNASGGGGASGSGKSTTGNGAASTGGTSQSLGKGGASPQGKDPAFGSGNGTTNAGTPRNQTTGQQPGIGGCTGSGCGGGGTQGDSRDRQDTSASRAAEQQAQQTRDAAVYANNFGSSPSIGSFTQQSISDRVSKTLSALEHVIGNLMRTPPAAPVDTTREGFVTGLPDGYPSTYKGTGLGADDFRALTEPVALKYDVTAEELDKEFKALDPKTLKRLPVTESFNTPFGNLGEIIDPSALNTPEKRKAVAKSVLSVVYGLPDNQVNAIIGNLTEESAGTFDPKVVGDKNLKDKAYGIAQERGARKDSLQEFGGTNVANTNLVDQIGHVVAELNGTSPNVDKGAKKVGDAYRTNPNMSVEQATKLFVTNFERPKGSNSGASASDKQFFEKTVANRITQAKAAGDTKSVAEMNNAPDRSVEYPNEQQPQTPAFQQPQVNVPPSNSPQPKKSQTNLPSFITEIPAFIRTIFLTIYPGTNNTPAENAGLDSNKSDNQNYSSSSGPFPLVI